VSEALAILDRLSTGRKDQSGPVAV
jgi:hypothetical protein